MAQVISTAQFDSVVLQSNVPVVVDFFAAWCGPCRQMGPSFDQLATELAGQYLLVKVNIDDDRELAVRYGVSSIPTLLYVKDGKVVAKETGALGKEALQTRIKTLLG